MKGLVFDIQRFCTHDGPGIRTTVFMKGCTLNCAWCHNPESISPKKELQTYFYKCIGCGACIEACPEGCHSIVDGTRVFNRDCCSACGACVEECYSGALVMAGEEISPQEVFGEILKDETFYKSSGGGVTFSGGEPLMQVDFISETLRLCRDRGIHTAVDTAGNIGFSNFEKVIPYTDLFLFDVKIMDDALHREYTGSGNALILENLINLDKFNVPITVRIPVIGGVNDDNENFHQIAKFISKLKNVNEVDILPYHSLGKGKLESLGVSASGNFETPGKEKLTQLAANLKNSGKKVKCRGLDRND